MSPAAALSALDVRLGALDDRLVPGWAAGLRRVVAAVGSTPARLARLDARVAARPLLAGLPAALVLVGGVSAAMVR